VGALEGARHGAGGVGGGGGVDSKGDVPTEEVGHEMMAATFDAGDEDIHGQVGPCGRSARCGEAGGVHAGGGRGAGLLEKSECVNVAPG